MVDLAAERARLTKELDEINEQIKRIKDLMAGPFSDRAPEEVVQKERKKLDSLQKSANKITGQLKSLE
jgi:valyl-tRNA synthetase